MPDSQEVVGDSMPKSMEYFLATAYLDFMNWEFFLCFGSLHRATNVSSSGLGHSDLERERG